MANRNCAIIIGAPRSGTTSLWRYLARHPQISESRVKELNFFYRSECDISKYDSCFGAGGIVTLEASPVYFHEHEEVACQLAAQRPDARLICILREPTARLVAAYRSERDWHGRVGPDMDFSKYADIVCNDLNPHPINLSSIEEATYVRDCAYVGIYFNIISNYLNYFPKEQMKVLFLDDMVRDPQSVINDICGFIGVDPDEMPSGEYLVENKGVNVRNLNVYHALRSVNGLLEPVLNRAPRVRHYLKSLHQRLNGAPDELYAESEAEGREKLADWYHPHNLKLRSLLGELYPGMQFPHWMN